MDDQQLVATSPSAKMVIASGVTELLAQIRPEWQDKSLILRVERLLTIDPSSACQRLLNAAIHDLREKIIVAGLDVAQEAANLGGLPEPKQPEQMQEYSTTNTINLAYHMGLVNRPEWRKLKRAYDIRKDLEHEDDQYEAGVEDCVYIFRTCIEIVLARDPISPVRVTDVKDIIESPEDVKLSNEILDDFSSSPTTRQLQIAKFLISISRDSEQTDIVRRNAVEALRSLRPILGSSAGASLGKFMQEKLKTNPASLADMKIAWAIGITPYMKKTKVRVFFEEFYGRFIDVGYRWTSFKQHTTLLDDYEDVGGLRATPQELREKFILWMVLCYIGEPGGYGMGYNRPVFYSNSGAPKILEEIKRAGAIISDELQKVAKNNKVKAATSDIHIARRLENLIDLIGI